MDEEVVVGAHGEDVFARHEVLRGVEHEAREGAAVLAEVVPVDVHVGEDGHSFEDDVDAAPRVATLDGQAQPVPRALVGLVPPGVRHLHRRPARVVEARRFRPGEVLAGVEAPGPGEEDAGPELARADGRAAARPPAPRRARRRGRWPAREGRRRARTSRSERRAARRHGRADHALARSRRRRSVSSTSTMSVSVVFSSWSRPRWNCA